MVCISPAYLAALRRKERSLAEQAMLTALVEKLHDYSQEQVAGLPPSGIALRVQGAVVHVNVAGFQPHEFSIQLRDDQLTLSAERHTRGGSLDRSVPPARFEHTIRLPFVPDPSKIRAQIKNGRLELFLVPAGRARPKVERISLN